MERAQPELEAVADTLWGERHLVEYLLFKLVTAKLILASDERRFVTHAMDEVEKVLEALRDAELRRMQALLPVAAAWNMPAVELSLAELAARAPGPMAIVFRDLQEAFATLTAEIEETAATNRRLASTGLAHVRTALDALTGPTVSPTYTASGRHDTAVVAPMRPDRAL